jgi:hypothetical protein
MGSLREFLNDLSFSTSDSQVRFLLKMSLVNELVSEADIGNSDANTTLQDIASVVNVGVKDKNILVTATRSWMRRLTEALRKIATHPGFTTSNVILTSLDHASFNMWSNTFNDGLVLEHFVTYNDSTKSLSSSQLVVQEAIDSLRYVTKITPVSTIVSENYTKSGAFESRLGRKITIRDGLDNELVREAHGTIYTANAGNGNSEVDTRGNKPGVGTMWTGPRLVFDNITPEPGKHIVMVKGGPSSVRIAGVQGSTEFVRTRFVLVGGVPSAGLVPGCGKLTADQRVSPQELLVSQPDATGVLLAGVMTSATGASRGGASWFGEMVGAFCLGFASPAAAANNLGPRIYNVDGFQDVTLVSSFAASGGEIILRNSLLLEEINSP